MATENPNSSPRAPINPEINTHTTPSAPPLPSSSSPNQPSSSDTNQPSASDTNQPSASDSYQPLSSNPDQPSSSYSNQPLSSISDQPSSSNPNQPSSLNPNVDTVEHLLPDSPRHSNLSHEPSESVDETIISVPGAILHLIDKHRSVQLAMGNFSVMQLRQGDNVITILASVGNEIQWPLTKDEACVKLDRSHYFFSFRAPKLNEKDDEMLNYGLTFASKGQDQVLKELDELLGHYVSFSKHTVEEKNGALDVSMAAGMSPSDLRSDSMKEAMERSCSAYWTTLAPNVEDYSGTAAKLIAVGSGQLVKGILWCGDVTVDRLRRGEMVLMTKIGPGSNHGVSPQTMKNIHRVKKMTVMAERVAGAILSGVLRISGFFASSVVNSRLAKKFFKYLPGELAIATLDGFSKVCDAVEVSGKNVMATSNTVTTELVTYKYGEETAKAANEGLDAAGHAIGAAWTVFKIRSAVCPVGAIKPNALSKDGIKSATEEMRAKALKDMEAQEESHKKKPKKSKWRRCCCCCC